MDYTINALATLSGVTVRTLHFYDEIGLLKPAYVADNGYRFYQTEQLLLLQQILFFRELGFELRQIQQILAQSDFDKLRALQSQKTLLHDKILKLQVLTKTIDSTINSLEGQQTMATTELFKGFALDSAEQEKYTQQVQEYLTDKQVDSSNISKLYGSAATSKNIKNWTKTGWEQNRMQVHEICTQLTLLLEKQVEPNVPEVQQIVRRHYEWLQQFWMPTKETYAAHADFIMETELQKFYANYHSQLASFFAKAIKIFAEQELS